MKKFSVELVKDVIGMNLLKAGFYFDENSGIYFADGLEAVCEYLSKEDFCDIIRSRNYIETCIKKISNYYDHDYRFRPVSMSIIVDQIEKEIGRYITDEEYDQVGYILGEIAAYNYNNDLDKISDYKVKFAAAVNVDSGVSELELSEESVIGKISKIQGYNIKDIEAKDTLDNYEKSIINEINNAYDTNGLSVVILAELRLDELNKLYNDKSAILKIGKDTTIGLADLYIGSYSDMEIALNEDIYIKSYDLEIALPKDCYSEIEKSMIDSSTKISSPDVEDYDFNRVEVCNLDDIDVNKLMR